MAMSSTPAFPLTPAQTRHILFASLAQDWERRDWERQGRESQNGAAAEGTRAVGTARRYHQPKRPFNPFLTCPLLRAMYSLTPSC